MINKWNINSNYSQDYVLARQFFDFLWETYSPDYALLLLNGDNETFNIMFNKWKNNNEELQPEFEFLTIEEQLDILN